MLPRFVLSLVPAAAVVCRYANSVLLAIALVKSESISILANVTDVGYAVRFAAVKQFTWWIVLRYQQPHTSGENSAARLIR